MAKFLGMAKERDRRGGYWEIFLGDGNIEKSGKANLDYWGITQSVMMKRALLLVHGTVGARSDLVGHAAKTGYTRVQSVELGKLADIMDYHMEIKL